MQVNIKVSYKFISILLFPARLYYHYWWAWSNILKLLKVTSLQYLYNIPQKSYGQSSCFCMQINIRVSRSWHYRFCWKWPNMSRVPKIERIMFLQYINKKSVASAFVFHFDAKHSDILRGSSHVRFYLLWLRHASKF